MKFLFVMDPLEKINVYGDSTFMLMKEVQERFESSYFCTPNDLFCINNRSFGKIKQCLVSFEKPFFTIIKEEEMCLGDFQIIFMRKDPPFDMSYIFATYLLDLVPKTTLVLNHPHAIRSANEKMVALQFESFIPKTMVTREISRAKNFASEISNQIVIKPWDGNGGRGVLVSHIKDPNFTSMLEILTKEEKEYIIVQEYISEVKKGDKRIILIDGEIAGWMARIPSEEDHRGNMHVGASIAAFELSERDKEICSALRSFLQESNLLFVGIDIIGEYLTEINVTSPTGIQEINKLQKLSLEQNVISSALYKYEEYIKNTK